MSCSVLSRNLLLKSFPSFEKHIKLKPNIFEFRSASDLILDIRQYADVKFWFGSKIGERKVCIYICETPNLALFGRDFINTHNISLHCLDNKFLIEFKRPVHVKSIFTYKCRKKPIIGKYENLQLNFVSKLDGAFKPSVENNNESLFLPKDTVHLTKNKRFEFQIYNVSNVPVSIPKNIEIKF